MWGQVLDLKKFGSCDGNVKFRSVQEGVFKFLRYLMVLKFLNDTNGFVLDLIFSKIVRSLIINIYLEML